MKNCGHENSCGCKITLPVECVRWTGTSTNVYKKGQRLDDILKNVEELLGNTTATLDIDIQNIGSGFGIYKGEENNIYQFKKLNSDDGVEIKELNDSIVFGLNENYIRSLISLDETNIGLEYSYVVEGSELENQSDLNQYLFNYIQNLTLEHNELEGLQGGTYGEMYHLTEEELQLVRSSVQPEDLGIFLKNNDSNTITSSFSIKREDGRLMLNESVINIYDQSSNGSVNILPQSVSVYHSDGGNTIMSPYYVSSDGPNGTFSLSTSSIGGYSPTDGVFNISTSYISLQNSGETDTVNISPTGMSLLSNNLNKVNISPFSIQTETSSYINRFTTSGLEYVKKTGNGGMIALLYPSIPIEGASYTIQLPQKSGTLINSIDGVTSNQQGEVSLLDKYLPLALPSPKTITTTATNTLSITGLQDKSTDLAYNKLLGFNASGVLAEVGIKAFLEVLQSGTQSDINTIFTVLNGSYLTSQIEINGVFPPILEKDNTTQEVTIMGKGLVLPEDTYINKVEIFEVSTSTYTQVSYQNLTENSMKIFVPTNLFDEGDYLVRITSGVQTHIGSLYPFTIAEIGSVEEVAFEDINWTTQKHVNSTQTNAITISGDTIINSRANGWDYGIQPSIGGSIQREYLFSDIIVDSDEDFLIEFDMFIQSQNYSNSLNYRVVDFVGIVPEDVVDENNELPANYFIRNNALGMWTVARDYIISTVSFGTNTTNRILFEQPNYINKSVYNPDGTYRFSTKLFFMKRGNNLYIASDVYQSKILISNSVGYRLIFGNTNSNTPLTYSTYKMKRFLKF